VTSTGQAGAAVNLLVLGKCRFNIIPPSAHKSPM
jgi:hypothetical protein